MEYKYIRTIDGIYEYNNSYIIENDTLYLVVFDDVYTDYGVNGKYSKGKILNQADTIEELCDGFYNDILNDFDCFGFDKLYIYHDFESFKDGWISYRVHDNWKGNGYGFIKTDKGLIYVAKMNEEGELKLI